MKNIKNDDKNLLFARTRLARTTPKTDDATSTTIAIVQPWHPATVVSVSDSLSRCYKQPASHCQSVYMMKKIMHQLPTLPTVALAQPGTNRSTTAMAVVLART